jgi:hypothetical protein
VLSGANWEADAAKANTREWWTVMLWYDDEAAGKFIYLSEQDFVNSGLKFHGVITNQPTIRESVDFKRCTSKVSNVTVDCQNIQYQGLPLSNELFGGSKKYINRTVEIFSSQMQNNYMGWLQIFSGRLTNVVPDLDKGTFTLTFENKTPFDLVSIPNTQTASGSARYFPIAYGDFSINSSKPGAEDYCSSRALFPVEVEQINNRGIRTLAPRSYASEARLHTYDSGQELYIPLVGVDGNYQDSSDSTYDANGEVIPLDTDYEYGWKVKPYWCINLAVAPAAFSNATNAIEEPFDDQDQTDNGATASLIAGDQSATLIVNMQGIDIPITTYDVIIVWTNSADIASARLTGYDKLGGTINTDETFGTVTAGTHTETITVTDDKLDNIYLISFNRDSADSDIAVFDIRFAPNAKQDPTDTAANASFRKNVKKLYVGANGLQDNLWVNGVTATDISEVHDIHRDLLHRFGGITGTPEGWTDINTEKANWDARLWLHKPTKLIGILEQLQYEGCFVYHTRATGAGAYLVLKSSYASGDVDMTLTNDRVKNLKITHIAPDDMVTKWEVSSNPHPADNSRYLEQETASSANRANWGFTGDENTETVELDYLVNTAAGAVDMSGFTDYREQVVGTVVQTVKFDLAYSKDMLLEVGDIIQFSGIATDPFGDLNTIYWAVTKTSRSVGKMNITALEVG